MKREIIYRAWERDEMHYSDSGDDSAIWRLDPHGMVCETYRLVNTCPGGMYHQQEDKWLETPGTEYMQYTGIQDKNRTRVFELDLIRVHVGSESIKARLFKVEQKQGAWGLTDVRETDRCFYGFLSFVSMNKSLADHDIFHLEYQDILEVVGNVYEHPELIEQTP